MKNFHVIWSCLPEQHGCLIYSLVGQVNITSNVSNSPDIPKAFTKKLSSKYIILCLCELVDSPFLSPINLF